MRRLYLIFGSLDIVRQVAQTHHDQGRWAFFRSTNSKSAKFCVIILFWTSPGHVTYGFSRCSFLPMTCSNVPVFGSGKISVFYHPKDLLMVLVSSKTLKDEPQVSRCVHSAHMPGTFFAVGRRDKRLSVWCGCIPGDWGFQLHLVGFIDLSVVSMLDQSVKGWWWLMMSWKFSPQKNAKPFKDLLVFANKGTDEARFFYLQKGLPTGSVSWGSRKNQTLGMNWVQLDIPDTYRARYQQSHEDFFACDLSHPGLSSWAR